MIRIFRNLKSDLVKEGKLGKYLVYAFGEIVLVVIGIIIAVQINNMIDNDKRKELQVDILKEIQKNLEGDLIEISEEVDNYELMYEYDSFLLAATRQRLPFTDSIASFAYTLEDNAHLNPTLSGYHLLQSKGIELITNDSLRIELTDLYERWYTYYAKYESERIQVVQTIIKPYMIKNFYLEENREFWTNQKRIPFNYDVLVKDPEWISIIQTNQTLARGMTRKARQLKQKIQGAQNGISGYLKKQ